MGRFLRCERITKSLFKLECRHPSADYPHISNYTRKEIHALASAWISEGRPFPGQSNPFLGHEPACWFSRGSLHIFARGLFDLLNDNLEVWDSRALHEPDPDAARPQDLSFISGDSHDRSGGAEAPL